MLGPSNMSNYCCRQQGILVSSKSLCVCTTMTIITLCVIMRSASLNCIKCQACFLKFRHPEEKSRKELEVVIAIKHSSAGYAILLVSYKLFQIYMWWVWNAMILILRNKRPWTAGIILLPCVGILRAWRLSIAAYMYSQHRCNINNTMVSLYTSIGSVR